MVIHLSGDLLTCERNSFGISVLESAEKQRADVLRAHVVTFLGEEESLRESAPDLPMILDSSVGTTYESLKDRLTKMSSPAEYAGFVEVAALAFLLKVQFEFYTVRKDTLVLHLYTRTPSESYKERQPVRILYTVDRTDMPGHYDLIVRTDIPAQSNCRTDILQNVARHAATASDNENATLFLDIIDPSRRSRCIQGLLVPSF